MESDSSSLYMWQVMVNENTVLFCFVLQGWENESLEKSFLAIM